MQGMSNGLFLPSFVDHRLRKVPVLTDTLGENKLWCQYFSAAIESMFLFLLVHFYAEGTRGQLQQEFMPMAAKMVTGGCTVSPS